jgi:regulator of protease activity HflC (stomatin/prohibitin superfamily)
MSDIPPQDPNLPAANPAMVRRRPASVQLRAGDASGATSDTANKALADALRVVYRFLQFGMIVLVAVFLLSGLQSVKEGERGIRVTLGKMVADDLTPGFQFSLPRPLGEILKFNTGNQALDLREEFWPNAPATERYKEDSVLANMGHGKLDPVQDGFLVMGDLSIGHVLAKVEYRRDPDKVKEYALHIQPASERPIVRAAVMQALVRAAAGVTIDQLRKENGIQINAKEFAQATLNKLKSGLQIVSLSVERRMVPQSLIKTFNEVEASLANANKAISEAEQYRQATLTGTAGNAAEDLLALIDRFDRQYTTGKGVEAEASLAKVDAILGGAPVGEDGKNPRATLAGKASQAMSEARSERGRVVSQAQANAALFKAKYDAFKTNPGVVLVGDWADAFARFVNRDTVQVFMLPPNVHTLDVLINRDPELQKEQEALLAKKQQEENFRKSFKSAEDQRLSAPEQTVRSP